MALRPLQFLATLAAAILIGVLLTWAIAILISLDLGHQWRRVPPLTADAGEIVAIWESTIYVQSVDGQLYSIEPESDTRWTAINSIHPTDDSYYSRREFFGACDRDDRFRWTTALPSDELECTEARTFMSVSSFSLAVIRDAHNQLWFFQTKLGSDFALPGMINALLCFLLTTFAAFILLRSIILFVYNKQKREDLPKRA